MTERKPPGVSWESWIDRQIREAEALGEFDHLPGKGKPIPDIDRRDELWWVKKKLQEEQVSWLPPSLAVRKERDDALQQIAGADSEAAVREIVAAVNARIREVNAHGGVGPASTVVPLDADEVVAEWRRGRGSTGPADA